MKKKKIPLRITGFTVLVLVLLAFLLFFRNGNNNDPLFDTNNSTTLYLETVAGKVPEIDFSIYFPGTDYDFTKFDYDKSTIDFHTPGNLYGSGLLQRPDNVLYAPVNTLCTDTK